MTTALFFAILFALFSLITIAMMIIQKKWDFFSGLMIFSVISFAFFMGDRENKIDATNVVTCNKIGIVKEANCALFRTTAKFPVTYAECRVELENGSRYTLDLLVLKGDQIEHCTNSLEKFKYADYHKISK